METTESLQRRIATAEELHSVVGAMKVLSSVSIRQHERAAASLGHYVHAIELGFRVLLHEGAGRLPGSRVPEDRPIGIVILGTDHGLCGPFNREIADHALAWLRQAPVRDPRPRIVCAGVRVASELDARGLAFDVVGRMPGSVEGVVGRVHDVLIEMEAWRAQGGVERVMLFHNRPTEERRYRPAANQLIPLDVERLRRLARHRWPTRMLPMFTLDAASLAAALTREYTFALLYRAFVESLASEHAARLAAMQGAERTIEERLVQLGLRFHQVRQAAITEELLDVTAGFEALGDTAM
ncbi:MAG: F0F1 ATP synthase subunit gamma [Chloroflexi bacterium]|nr:F0F1 ATP synthase subunit gamma [Chloroflexota bacterium]